MMKRLFITIMTLSLMLTAFVPAAYATETTGPAETLSATEPVQTVPETTAAPEAAAPEETVQPTQAPTEAPAEAPTEAPTEPERPANACGEDLTWSLSGTTLTISGTGAMDSFYEGAPWKAYKDSIETVVLTGGVTTVGAAAFTDYDQLKSVDFGSSLREIDTAAFRSCDGLTSISLPGTFRRFGEESFYGCSGLKEIHCSGGMPSFNMNCLWASYLKIYFPTNNPWPLVHIEQLETAFQGRIEFLAADGSDPYVPTEPEEETQPQTKPQETTPPTTVPDTVPPTTAPVTEPATEPTAAPTEVTQPQIPETVPATQPPETEAPTEAPETAPEEPTDPEGLLPEEQVSRGILGLVLICAGLTLLVVGALVLRFRRGGKYGR